MEIAVSALGVQERASGDAEIPAKVPAIEVAYGNTVGVDDLTVAAAMEQWETDETVEV